MTDLKRRIYTELTIAGATFVRRTKHEIWKLNGHIIVVSSSPSDERALRNIRADIRRAIKCPRT